MILALEVISVVIVINEGGANVLRSAYREVDGEDYVTLWPSALTEFNVL